MSLNAPTDADEAALLAEYDTHLGRRAFSVCFSFFVFFCPPFGCVPQRASETGLSRS